MQMCVKYVLKCYILIFIFPDDITSVARQCLYASGCLIYLFATHIVFITVFFQVVQPQPAGKVGQLFCKCESHRIGTHIVYWQGAGKVWVKTAYMHNMYLTVIMCVYMAITMGNGNHAVLGREERQGISLCTARCHCLCQQGPGINSWVGVCMFFPGSFGCPDSPCNQKYGSYVNIQAVHSNATKCTDVDLDLGLGCSLVAWAS